MPHGEEEAELSASRWECVSLWQEEVSGEARLWFGIFPALPQGCPDAFWGAQLAKTCTPSIQAGYGAGSKADAGWLLLAALVQPRHGGRMQTS